MFQQQAPRKERSKLAVFSAPANMLSFRSPSMVTTSSSTGGAAAPPFSSSNGPTSSSAPGQSQSPSFQPGSPSQQASSDKQHAGKKAEAHESSKHAHQSSTASNPGWYDKVVLPAPLPGPEETSDVHNSGYTAHHHHQHDQHQHQDNKQNQQSSQSQQSNASPSKPPRLPTSRRPPVDPIDAPGVTFASNLRPPAGARIPDIPYGEGRPKKTTRQVSISGSGTGSSSSRPRVFTPSDAHTGIRIGNDDSKQQPDFTAKNAKADTTTTIIASSQPPATSLYTPVAPLTVNAPVVTPKGQLVTSLDPSAMENLKVQNSSGSASAKQPTKSALKAKSWADLVRPPNNVQIAQQAVKNVGLPPAFQRTISQDRAASSTGTDGYLGSDAAHEHAKHSNESARKKKVQISLPSSGHTEASSGATTPTPETSGERASRHVSPPPPEKKSTDAGVNGEGESTSGRAPSIISTATANGGGSAILSSTMHKKRTLDEILYGVENSSTGVVLYPRGLVNTGNACFMNSILQTLLFTPPFYNLISLIGSHTSEDLSGKTPLLDAMVSYLSEFRTSSVEREKALKQGESYEEYLSKTDAFVPSIIYHALNHSTRFSQMGFYNPTMSSMNGTSSSSSHIRHKHSNSGSGSLSQEDAQEFLGFFLDTLHEELLIKTEQFDKQSWEKINKGFKQGVDSLSRQSVNNGTIAYDDPTLHNVQAPIYPGAESVVNTGGDEGSVRATDPGTAEGADEDWLEVGQKGRTATTRTTETSASAITRIFGGQLRSVLRCPGQKDSVTLEPYMSLQLEIQSPHVQTVTDALSFISHTETLTDVANKNNQKVDATKQVFIESLPPVLILHLKRFYYDSREGGVRKSHKIVSYGTELEIPKDCIAPTKRTGSGKHALKNKYRLQGVVYHHGKSATGGHYTVNVRQNSGRWVNIDDTTITPVTADDAATDRDKENMRLSLPSASRFEGVPDKSAYLLFYQRI